MGIPEILFQAFRAQNRGNTWGYSGSRMGQNRHVTKSIIGSINTETIVAIALKTHFMGDIPWRISCDKKNAGLSIPC